jgi:hypothetical protein
MVVMAWTWIGSGRAQPLPVVANATAPEESLSDESCRRYPVTES